MDLRCKVSPSSTLTNYASRQVTNLALSSLLIRKIGIKHTLPDHCEIFVLFLDILFMYF